MLITIKTLTQQTFQVDIEQEETVLQLKEKILKAKGFEVDAQKLIFAGKMLENNDATIKSFGINENAFVVLMMKKPAAAAKAVPATPASAAPVAPAGGAAGAVPQTPAPAVASGAGAVPDTPVKPAKPEGAAGAGAGAAQPDTPSAPSLARGAEVEAAIQQVMAMGFPRDQVVAALDAAFGNPERAIEYLINGIPENVRPSAARVPAPAGAGAVPAAGAGAGVAPAVPAAGAGAGAHGDDLFGEGTGAGTAEAAAGLEGNPFAALMRNPQFVQIARMMAQNPTLIQPVLAQLAQTNPQIAQMIAQNPQALAEALSAIGGMDGEGEGEEAGEGEAGAPAGGVVPPRATIQLSPEDQAAITRLCELGFDRNIVIQAYFACEKNEMLAANYLLEHGFD